MVKVLKQKETTNTERQWCVALDQLSVPSVMRGMTPAMLEALCDISIEPRDEHMMSDIINDHGTFLTSPKKLSGVYWG